MQRKVTRLAARGCMTTARLAARGCMTTRRKRAGTDSRVKQLQAEVVRLKAAIAQSEIEVKRLSESEGQPAETVASTDQVNMILMMDSEICEEYGYA